MAPSPMRVWNRPSSSICSSVPVDMCSGSSSSQHITWLPRGNCSRRNASHSFDIVRIFCLLCSFVDHSHLYGWAVLLLLIPVLTEQILQIRRFTVLDRVVLQVLLSAAEDGLLIPGR